MIYYVLQGLILFFLLLQLVMLRRSQSAVDDVKRRMDEFEVALGYDVLLDRLHGGYGKISGNQPVSDSEPQEGT